MNVEHMLIEWSLQDMVVTFFPRKEPEQHCLEVCHASNLEFAIMERIASISKVENACTGVMDLAALIVDVTASHLMTEHGLSEISFPTLYRNATGDLVRTFRIQYSKERMANVSTETTVLARACYISRSDRL